MKDEKARGVIRFGDKTSHGGEVVSACNDFKVLGVAFAREGDMASCPLCGDNHAIKPAASTRKHHGKQLAYHDDPVACGATLISSIS